MHTQAQTCIPARYTQYTGKNTLNISNLKLINQALKCIGFYRILLKLMQIHNQWRSIISKFQEKTDKINTLVADDSGSQTVTNIHTLCERAKIDAVTVHCFEFHSLFRV